MPIVASEIDVVGQTRAFGRSIGLREHCLCTGLQHRKVALHGVEVVLEPCDGGIVHLLVGAHGSFGSCNHLLLA